MTNNGLKKILLVGFIACGLTLLLPTVSIPTIGVTALLLTLIIVSYIRRLASACGLAMIGLLIVAMLVRPFLVWVLPQVAVRFIVGSIIWGAAGALLLAWCSRYTHQNEHPNS